MMSIRSRRIAYGVDGVLVLLMSASWIAAVIAARRSVETLPPGTRLFTLGVYETTDRLDLALALGLVGVVALIARHRFPLPTFVFVAAVMLIISRFFPFITRLQFATGIMLTVAAFWAMWRTRHFLVLAIVSMVAAILTTVPIFQVNQNLSDIGLVESPVLTSLSTTGQAVILMAAAIAGAALVRRFDAQATELAARNEELEAQRAASSRAAVLDERVRISRELHDVVAHHVASMTVHSGAARQVIGVNPDAAVESLQQIEQSGRDAITELQRLLGFLRGPR